MNWHFEICWYRGPSGALCVLGAFVLLRKHPRFVFGGVRTTKNYKNNKIHLQPANQLTIQLTN